MSDETLESGMGPTIVSRVTRLLSSYGLSVVLLLLLLLLTYLGTVYQVEHGLYAAIHRYFASLVVVEHLFGVVPIPLPGVYLLLVVFFVNLVFGGIVNTRWTWSRAGVLIAHFGIFFLLFGGFIAKQSMVEGNLTLFEGEQSAEFRSHHEWEVAITRAPETRDAASAGPAVEYLIPESDFADLGGGERRTFRGGSIPFTLTVTRSMLNSWPVNAARRTPTNPVVEGVYLEERAPDKQAEANLRGMYVEIRGKSAHLKTVLWGGAEQPLLFREGGERWAVELRKVRHHMPFAIRLDKFHHELHPGTKMAKSYMSDVTKIENGQERQIRIQMNEPLRSEGYTLFQSGWGPKDARPGTPLFSSFSVVSNPADQWPLYACIIIGFGLLLHFGRMLGRYLARETEKRA